MQPPTDLCLAEALAAFPDIWPIIFTIDLMRYVVFAGAAAALLWLCARADRRRIQTRRATAEDRRREIGYSLLTALIFSFNGFFLIWVLQATGLTAFVEGSPAWQVILGAIALIVAHDAWFYWMHRALHLRRFFRLAHITHHRSLTPTPWAAYAFAPAEAMVEAIFLPIFLLLVPTDGLAVMIFLMHMMARNVLGHLGHEILPRGWVDCPLTHWITTPTHHDLHHAHGRWNYGLYFTWWDRLMGTEHPHYRDRFRAAAGDGRHGELSSLAERE